MMSSNTSKTKVNHKEDRLSDLPDEILIKIISCLKTKEAVRTGILSTRWKSVWASVPTPDLCQFDFCFKGEDDNDAQKVADRFSNFVDRAALERNVSELYVSFYKFYDGPPCELTHDLFSYNKLVVLKLCIDMTLYFPTASSCFPNLKVLELKGISYRDDDSLPNLLSSCPILEDLVIIKSTGDNLGTLNLTSCSLKRLKVNCYFDFPNKLGDVPKMVIDAPAVESLDICCVKAEEYVVKDLSSIVEAKLDLFNHSSFSKTYKLLRDVSNVKFLRLGHRTVETLKLSDSYNLPMFYNLTHLEIYGDDRFVDDDHSISLKLFQWKLMLEILKSSPILQILIYEAHSFSLDKCGTASDWDVPNCLVSCLKTVEFYYYSDDDVEKVRYFLINAQVLEKMTIKPFLPFKKSLKLELCNVILEIERGSLTWSDKEIVISFL